MDLCSALICPVCNHSELQYDRLVTEAGLPSGEISCSHCRHIMHVNQGVIDIFNNQKVSELVIRNKDAYSDFWERGANQSDEDVEVTHEDVLFKDWQQFLTGKSMIDVGCGNGRQIHHFTDLEYHSFYFVDVSDAIYKARDRFQRLRQPHQFALFIRGALDSIPLKDKTVDDAWSSGTIGLVENQGEAIDEIARLTKMRMNISVLTEKTMTGKLYIAANLIKPIVNKINNFELLFKAAGAIAIMALTILKIYYRLGLSSNFLRRETVGNLLKRKDAKARIQWALYDPVVIPRVIKHPDQFYIQRAKSHGFKLKRHMTEIICDYYFFVAD
jgi:ubiquinone/menaquinone biosynthesis C-methylase UbiE